MKNTRRTHKVSTNEKRKLNRIPAIWGFGLIAATAVAIVVSMDFSSPVRSNTGLDEKKRTYSTVAGKETMRLEWTKENRWTYERHQDRKE